MTHHPILTRIAYRTLPALLLLLTATGAHARQNCTSGMCFQIQPPFFVADCWSQDFQDFGCPADQIAPLCGEDSNVLRLLSFETQRAPARTKTYLGFHFGAEPAPLAIEKVIARDAKSGERLDYFDFNRVDGQGGIEAAIPDEDWEEFYSYPLSDIPGGVEVELVLCVRPTRELDRDGLLDIFRNTRIAVTHVSPDGVIDPLDIFPPNTALDTDGDGVPNSIDPCPFSDTSATIDIGSCPDQENIVLSTGCTLADVLAPCYELQDPDEQLECLEEAFERLAEDGFIGGAQGRIWTDCVQPQTATFNRVVRSVEIDPVPGRPGEARVRFETALELFGGAREDRDIGWAVILRNGRGDLLAEIPVPVNVPAQPIEQCAGLGCPGPCGEVDAHNGTVQLTCVDSESVPDACSCQLICPGEWQGPFDTPDTLVVEVLPLPGSLPELDPRDDVTRVDVTSLLPPPNRSVGPITMLPTPGESGAWDVLTALNIEVFGEYAEEQDVGTRVRFLTPAGDVLEERVFHVAVPASNGGHCLVGACDVPCGEAVIDGADVPMQCGDLPDTVFGCACSVRIPVVCGGCVVEDYVVVEVEALPTSVEDADESDNTRRALIPSSAGLVLNRRIGDVRLTPVPGTRGRYDVEVDLVVEQFGPSPNLLDASTEIVVRSSDGASSGHVSAVVLKYSWEVEYSCEGDDRGGPCGRALVGDEEVDATCETSPLVGEGACVMTRTISIGEIDLGSAEFPEVWIHLLPAPGAVGEVETRDDIVRCVDGGACFPPEAPTTFFDDFEHRALGEARLSHDDDKLILSNIGASGDDGVQVSLPALDNYRIEWEATPDESAPTHQLTMMSESDDGETPGGGGYVGVVMDLDAFEEERPTTKIQAAFEFRGKPVDFDVRVLDRGEIVHETGPTPVQAADLPIAFSECTLFWCIESGCYYVDFPGGTRFEVDGKVVTGDQIGFFADIGTDGGAGIDPIELTFRKLSLEASGFSEIVITEESTMSPPTGEPEFLRGDATGEGTLDLSDGIKILGFLFLGEGTLPCLDAADTNDSGGIDLSDAVAVFGYLFLGAEPPASPGPDDCGPDPTDDGLDCESHAFCAGA